MKISTDTELHSNGFQSRKMSRGTSLKESNVYIGKCSFFIIAVHKVKGHKLKIKMSSQL